MTVEGAKVWCAMQHENTNHMYDKFLPYRFHLKMVAGVGVEFRHLIEGLFIEDSDNIPGYDRSWEIIELACWGHDLIEDTRLSYNDVLLNLGRESADIIYAVTNEKGKNRAERGNEKYYEGIRNTPGAQFVKMCDRIANAKYSKFVKSRMFDMYKKENEGFLAKIQCPYPEMVNHLNELFI